ncbi:helix-turn-helix transcriptional regulator [Yinghuangia seranimata]|uniref:helix-turn-helix transcriptional regulator n=1 Tax=Yinghuangia seranimata TaxID=408067 RepID=UPI00248CEFBB|nr:LuxR family transcriptional regulator [Yinghuangia seranimata]MDI2130020.1 AAA family ATPase [Yinghuangia seranimata]
MVQGRAAEQATVGALLDAARSGTSGVLVVRGEPGIGKTTLLKHAVAAAEAAGIPVVQGTGVEFEAELAYAGLSLLLRPALAHTAALPEPQRQALDAALGLASGAAPEPMFVGLAVLSLLSEYAGDGPLLCVVDDAQWLDKVSSDALVFAARRLHAEGVVVLFGARDGEGSFPAPGLPELRLTGLPAAEAGALLDTHAADLTPTARYRVLAEANGNPLALLELPVALASENPSAVFRPGALPLTSRLQMAFHGQVSRLPAATQTLLLVIALDDTGDIGVVLRAAEALGAQATDLEPAHAADLVRLDDGTPRFRHPLIRAAVHQRAPLDRRLTVHQALAAALDAPDQADRRAWQLAAASTTPDAAVADALDATAEGARERGGYAAAARAYEHSARLTVDQRQRVRRLALAAKWASEAGELDRARDFAARSVGHSTDPVVRATLTLVQGLADFWQGSFPSAHKLLLAGAEDVADEAPTYAARLLVQAAHTAWYLSEAELHATLDRLDALDLPEDDPITPVARYLVACLGASGADGTTGPDGPAAGPASGSTPAENGTENASPTAAPARRAAGAGRAAGVVAGRAASGSATAADDAPEQGAAKPPTRSRTGSPPLSDALAAARAAGEVDARVLQLLCGVALTQGQDEDAYDLAVRLVADSRRNGGIGRLPTLLFFKVEAEVFQSRFNDGLATASEALGFARDTGQQQWTSQFHSVLAILHGLSGDEAACREAADASLTTGAGGAMASGTPWAYWALGMLDLGLGRAASALSRFEQLTREPLRHHICATRSTPDLLEAAVRLGEPERAAESFARFEAWADRVRQPWADAIVLRCQALLSDDADAEVLWTGALALHDPDRRPMERARTALLYGEWLRRVRRKTDARDHLRTALEEFERIGARPWAERARTELDATGTGTARPATASPTGALAVLTPQELQITRLAAQGMSNRDIAAQLFLSPRTVGHHLYKAYPKLGIVSRTELSSMPELLGAG